MKSIVTVSVPSELVAVTVVVEVSALVKVPLITPVVVLIDNPGGRLLAEYVGVGLPVGVKVKTERTANNRRYRRLCGR